VLFFSFEASCILAEIGFGGLNNRTDAVDEGGGACTNGRGDAVGRRVLISTLLDMFIFNLLFLPIQGDFILKSDLLA
jgi:hypothetical protein